MVRLRDKLFVCLGAAALAVALPACPQKEPEVRVLEARSKYTLEPSGVLINELETGESIEEDSAMGEPVAAAAEAVAVAAVAAEAAEAEEGEEFAEGEDPEEETQTGPRSVEVLFDLLVRYNGDGEPLPGITVDVVHNDPFQKEKARHLAWVETAGLRKGEQRQVSVSLEVDNYEDGDEFSVEWNAFVPPEKRGEYREFSEAGP